MTFKAWAAGLLPAYRPTMADLYAYSIGLADVPPHVIERQPMFVVPKRKRR